MKSLELAQILNKAKLIERKIQPKGTCPGIEDDVENLVNRLESLYSRVLEERYFRTLNNRALKMFVDDPATIDSERRLTEAFNRRPQAEGELELIYDFGKYLLIKTESENENH